MLLPSRKAKENQAILNRQNKSNINKKNSPAFYRKLDSCRNKSQKEINLCK
jgi:hypothetical protein